MNTREERPWLTIITVTFRDIPGVMRTLRSIEPLKLAAGRSIEVIVLDGGTPNFHAATAEFVAWANVLSGPDAGIYDAMNKGLALASGHLIWFLNGGDVCLLKTDEELRSLIDPNIRAMWVGNYVLDTGSHLADRTAHGHRYIYHGLPTSHQAILYPAEETQSERYDLDFSIVGDYELTSRLYKRGIPLRRIPLALAQFETGGTSQQHAKEIAIQAWTVQQRVLGSPFAVRAASRMLHFASRTRRAFQTRSPE